MLFAADIRGERPPKAAHELALGQLHARLRVSSCCTRIWNVSPGRSFPRPNVPRRSAEWLWAKVQASLEEFAKHKNLLAWNVAQYNPDRDPDGAGARKDRGLACQRALRAAGRVTPGCPLAAEETPSATGLSARKGQNVE